MERRTLLAWFAGLCGLDDGFHGRLSLGRRDPDPVEIARVNEVMRRHYPPAMFQSLVEQESAFRKALRG